MSAPPRVTPGHRTLAGSVVFTLLLLGSIALAIRNSNPVIAIWALAAVTALVALFHLVFADSDFFSIVFANSVGNYACIYVVLISANFAGASLLSQQIGFLMPLLCFGLGVLTHRKEIQRLIESTGRLRPFHGLTRWVGPLAVIAVLTTYFQSGTAHSLPQTMTLTIAMAAVSAIAWIASRNIALFLIEIGTVFKSFVVNIARLTRPAFALLTCYSLIIIFFGSAYTIFDQASQISNFAIVGSARHLTFPEGLYLSVATLTMVGFGDIAAVSPTARLLVSVEILCGVVLLLFGVEAMLERSGRGAAKR